jgi:hypothetical protein
MASVLIERETVDKDELVALLEGNWAEQLEKEKAAKEATAEAVVPKRRRTRAKKEEQPPDSTRPEPVAGV